MRETETPLTDLRQRIDRIDDQIHDLVIARAALVDEIRRTKRTSGAPVIQPQRETAMLRRLAARHKGNFPLAALVRIWREMIAAFTHLQQPLAVAVYAPEDMPGGWDLARDHFGSIVPMSAYQTIGQVFRAVTDRSATVGVVPVPQEQDDDPWWRQLLSGDSAGPRVFARLPATDRGNARGAGDVLAIACQVGDLSAVDHSLIVVEVANSSSRMKVISSLGAAGFSGALVAVSNHDRLYLILLDIDGPVTLDDPRFGELGAQLGTPLERVYHLGGYAEPIRSDAAARPGAPHGG
jgi:chorismate mutase